MTTDVNSFVLNAGASGAAASGALGSFVAPFDMQIVEAAITSGSNASSDVVLDINVEGTSLFGENDRPTIASGSDATTARPPAKVLRQRDGYADDFESGGVVLKGQTFSVDVDTAGAGASDLSAALHCIKI